jgi:hypothetical protein
MEGNVWNRFFRLVLPRSLLICAAAYLLFSWLQIGDAPLLAGLLWLAIVSIWVFSPQHSIARGIGNIYWFDWLAIGALSGLAAQISHSGMPQSLAYSFTCFCMGLATAVRARRRRPTPTPATPSDVPLEKNYVRAKVTFRSPEQGGRSCMVQSNNYAPGISVGGDRSLYYPVWVFGLPADAVFGAEYEVQLELWADACDYTPMVEAKVFEMMEGARMVGTGEVLSEPYRQRGLHGRNAG